jgi:GAF domain-containing protein
MSSHPSSNKSLEPMRRLNVLAAANIELFDAITKLVSTLLKVPYVSIRLIDDKQQWFCSNSSEDICQHSLNFDLRAEVIGKGRQVIVENATADPVFMDHPLVVGPPWLKSCISAPIRPDQEFVVGSVTVMDVVPRRFSPYENGIFMVLVQQMESFLRGHQELMVRQLSQLPVADLANVTREQLTAFKDILHYLVKGYLVLDIYLQLQPGPEFNGQNQLSSIVGKYVNEAIEVLLS